MNEPTMETLTRRLHQVEKNEEVGCGLVAFFGHERARFAPSCAPKSLELLNLLRRTAIYESVGQRLESS